MADQDTQALFLQVDASIELLRRNLGNADAPMSKLEQRAAAMAAKVDSSIAEMGKRFGPFAQLAETAATRAEKAFSDSFGHIEKLAATAIQAPTLKDGGLDLGSAQIRAAAEEAQRLATARGIIEQAAQRAAAGEGVLTEQTRLYLQAATAARIEAEQRAAALFEEAGAVERLEIETRQAGGALQAFGQQQGRAIVSTGQLRAGSQQLAYNISDIAVQFNGGTNVMMIFAQQGSQVVQAIALMKGEATGFIGFMGGPWGAVILGAVSILGVLATKHAASADNENLHKVAAKSLTQAIDELYDATNRQIGSEQKAQYEALATAAAYRQKALDARTAALETIRLARASLLAQRSAPTLTTNGFGANPGISTAAQRLDKLNADFNQIEANITKNEVAFRQAQVPILARQVAERNDPATAVNGRFERQSDVLAYKFKSGQFGKGEAAEAAYAAKLDQLTKARDTQLKAIEAAKKKGPKGPSQETLDKRAEAARVAEIRDDTAYNDEERQARHKLLEATRKTASSEEERDKLLREDINAEADATNKKIANQLSAKDIDAAQAKHLTEINEATRRQRLQNVTIARATAAIERQYDTASDEAQAQIAVLRVRQDLATTTAERRKIADDLLKLEQEERRRALERTRDTSNDPNEVQRAKDQLGRLPDLEKAERDRKDREQEGPLAQFRRQVKEASGDINVALESVEARGLQSLEDGIVDAITGAKSLGDAFKDVANQIIADLIRIAVQKAVILPLADSLFSGFGGGGGKSAGLASKLASNFGGARAAGGRVQPGSWYMVGEEGPEPFFPDTAGTILPNRLRTAPSSGLAGGAGASAPIRLLVSLSDDLNARIDTRAAGVSVQVMREGAPSIVEAATGATIAKLSRRGI